MVGSTTSMKDSKRHCCAAIGDLMVHQRRPNTMKCSKRKPQRPRRCRLLVRRSSVNFLFFVFVFLVIIQSSGCSSSASSSSSSSSHTQKANNNPLSNPTTASITPATATAETLVPTPTNDKMIDSKDTVAVTKTLPKKKKKSKTTKKGAKKTKDPNIPANNNKPTTTLSTAKKPPKSSPSSSPTTTLSATQAVFVRRLQREWKDAVDMGIAYDWVRGKPIRRQTTKGKKDKKKSTSVAFVNDVGNVNLNGMKDDAMGDIQNADQQEKEPVVASDDAATVVNTVAPNMHEDIAASIQTDANTTTTTDTFNDADHDGMENATAASDTHNTTTATTSTTISKTVLDDKTNTTTTNTTCKKVDGGHICMGPLGSNLFNWHFSILGVEGSPYEGGIYHGRLIIPPQYPSQPPRVQLWTPSGRFIPFADICLSASAYHPESWNPSAWNLRTIIESLRLHMLTPAIEIGGMSATLEERQEHALKSRKWVVEFETSKKRQRQLQKIEVNHPAMIRQNVFPSLVVMEEELTEGLKNEEEDEEWNKENFLKVRNEQEPNLLPKEQSSQPVQAKKTKKKKRQHSGDKQLKTTTGTTRRSRSVDERLSRRSLVHDYKLLKSGIRLGLLLLLIYWVIFCQ